MADAPVPEPSPESPGFWTRAIWYLPNRVLDLLDIFRLRVKTGLGLEAGVRATDTFAFYAGQFSGVAFGLPGPRTEAGLPVLFSPEQRRGLVLFGVEATDDFPHPPQYEFSEIGVNLHLFAVGLEVGVSPAAFWDFLLGWIGRDPQGDDFPQAPPPPGSPGTSPPAKPVRFDGVKHRLNYLLEEVPLSMQEHMHEVDLWLSNAPAEGAIPPPPVTNLRLEFRYSGIGEPESRETLRPRMHLSLRLPNFSRRSTIFVKSFQDDELPGVNEADRAGTSWTVGARREMRLRNVVTDVGVRTKWPPEPFARIAWRPEWEWDDWHFGFEQRLFWELDDGSGLLTSLYGFHWLGRDNHWIFRTLTAGRVAEHIDGYEWQQTLAIGYLPLLRDELIRLWNADVGNALKGVGLRASAFGEDRALQEYRLTTVFRHPLHLDFVVLEVEPGLQWKNEFDWQQQYRIDIKLILFF